MLYNKYIKKWKVDFCLSSSVNNFGLKLEEDDAHSIEQNNLLFNGFNDEEEIKYLGDEYIFNLVVNLCMRKGHKKLAFNMVKDSFSLVRSFFWIKSFFFIRLILVKSEAVFNLQRYFLGKREKIIPRFIHEKQKIRYILRMLIKYAKLLQKEYKYFNVSFIYALIEYSKLNNVLNVANKEENELAEMNKYFLFGKNKKRKRKVRLFRKINDWKNLLNN